MDPGQPPVQLLEKRRNGRLARFLEGCGAVAFLGFCLLAWVLYWIRRGVIGFARRLVMVRLGRPPKP